MSLKTIILKKLDESSSTFKCEILNNDNSKSETDVSKGKCDLILYLSQIKHKISEREMEKLKTLIDAYKEEDSNFFFKFNRMFLEKISFYTLLIAFILTMLYFISLF